MKSCSLTIFCCIKNSVVIDPAYNTGNDFIYSDKFNNKYYENGIALKGSYAKIFEEEYLKVLNDFRNIIDVDYREYLDSFEASKIHADYFSIDKKGHEVDSKINDKKEYLSFDEDAYDLIMKDKERLLSLSEPVRFIFSHSALREGWDNPNIFQICTLKRSNSEISKRQEIGRGLRICVNNNGDRMDFQVLADNFFNVNTLTVIASESYDSFARSLQTEMAESLSLRPNNFAQEYFIHKVLVNDDGDKYVFTASNYNKLLFFYVQQGYVDIEDNSKMTNKFYEDLENDELVILPELIPFQEQVSHLLKKLYWVSNTDLVSDARKENIKYLMPNENFLKKEFQELWNKINVKTVYEVSFDTNELILKSIDAINCKLSINKMRAKITEGIQEEELTSSMIRDGESLVEQKVRTEVIEDFSSSQIKYDLIGEITRDTGLTRKTIIRILSKIAPSKFFMYQYNPEAFIRKVSTIINDEKALLVIKNITYYPTDQKYSNDIFKLNNLSGELGKNAIVTKKHIYDFLIADSKNEIEFAKNLEVGEVVVYAKLPSAFKIPTPVGNYNPDWAIVSSNPNCKYVYFVAETKASIQSMELRGIELAKIECAKKHFECLNQPDIKYDVVDSYDTLMEKLMK